MILGIVWYAVAFLGIWVINTLLDSEKEWEKLNPFAKFFLVTLIPIFIVVIGIITLFEDDDNANTV